MISPIKSILIISSTIAPVDTNIVYKLPNDYSYEAALYNMKNDGQNQFMSDILYKIISDELNGEPVE